MRSSPRFLPACIAAASLCAMATSAYAQARDSIAPTGAFVGRIINQTDSTAVRGAAIHLLKIDSTRASSSDADVIYVDSTKTRFGVTDSAGAFAVRGIAAGRYLLQIRRIGFRPREGVLSVDSVPVRVSLPLEPMVQALAGMTITETSVDRNGSYLKNVGYTFRSRGGLGGFYMTNASMEQERWWTLGEALLHQHVSGADVLIDGMPARSKEVEDYPIAQIMAVEIYRFTRPLEFDYSVSRAGSFSTRRPLILVWTFR